MKSKKINITVMSLLAALLLLNYSAEAGTIKGKISVKGARDARDVVVYIENVAGVFKAPEEPAKMDQKDMVFIPHVMPILKGTTVDYFNSDDVRHNVFTPDKCGEKFNLGSWPKGESRSFTYEELGCEAVMLCNVHPEMEAWVVVLQNPYFYKTDKTGTFSIENVPVGKYTLKVWHKKLKGKPQEIEVTADGEISVDFLMKR